MGFASKVPVYAIRENERRESTGCHPYVFRRNEHPARLSPELARRHCLLSLTSLLLLVLIHSDLDIEQRVLCLTQEAHYSKRLPYVGGHDFHNIHFSRLPLPGAFLTTTSKCKHAHSVYLYFCSFFRSASLLPQQHYHHHHQSSSLWSRHQNSYSTSNPSAASPLATCSRHFSTSTSNYSPTSTRQSYQRCLPHQTHRQPPQPQIPQPS